MALLRFILILCIPCLFSACARPFVKPDLTAVSYKAAGNTESRLDFDLAQQPLALPNHFAGKLNKANIQLHALRVLNYTTDTVWIKTQDVQLLAGGIPLVIVPPRQVYKALRQPVAVHALWFLVGPFIRTEGGERMLDYHPLGVAAVAWGLGNGIVAYRSNREAKELVWLTMPAGDTFVPPSSAIYLLVPLRKSALTTPIELRYNEPNRG